MKRACLTFLAAASLIALAQSATAVTLNVPYYSQLQTEWCWAASSQMVLGFYGSNITQTNIALYGSQGSNVPNVMVGSQAATTTTPALNGIDLILQHFGSIGSSFYTSALTSTQLLTELSASNLVVARLGWSTIARGAFNNNAGGHFIVLYGYDGTTVDVDDPEPFNGSFMEIYTTLLGGPAGTYRPGAARFMWTHSLVTASAIDAVIQIDSTGSMSDEIDAVIPEASQLAYQIFSTFHSARIAVVDYKDNPDYSGDFGATDDYIAFTDQTFTTNVNDVITALNNVGNKVYGGGDIPEAVYSALYNTLEGGASLNGEFQTSVLATNAGGWRPDPVKRIIIDMGDAGGHDPVEPWTDGHSIADVTALASTLHIQIDTIPCAVDFGSYYDPQCLADFGALASGSGGISVPAGSGGAVVSAFTNIIQNASSNRSPSGVVMAFKPVFTFTLDGSGMLNPPSYYEIQILRSNANKGTFSSYISARVKTNSYVPSSPMPTNTYRWRVGFAEPASQVLSAVGTKLGSFPAKVVYDNAYVEFQREINLPAAAVTLTPSSSEATTNYSVASAYDFQATSATETYSWTAGINATSYSVAIYAYNAKKGEYKLWKRLTVAPPAKNPTAATLSVKVGGHTKNDYYEWTIESLNYDHPKATSTIE